MFDNLTGAERNELAARMERAADRFDTEYQMLRNTPASALHAYGIGPGYRMLVTDWLMAAVDAGSVLYDLRSTTAKAMSRGAGDE